MPIVAWGEEYLVGIQEFDAHHEHLVGIMNRTYDEYTHNPTAGNLEHIIKELTDYTAYHFDAEEKWMEKVSYPKLSQQRNEHEQFAVKVAEFRKDADNVTSSGLFIFLADWLTTHILESDAEYGRFTGLLPFPVPTDSE